MHHSSKSFDYSHVFLRVHALHRAFPTLFLPLATCHNTYNVTRQLLAFLIRTFRGGDVCWFCWFYDPKSPIILYGIVLRIGARPFQLLHRILLSLYLTVKVPTTRPSFCVIARNCVEIIFCARGLISLTLGLGHFPTVWYTKSLVW